MGAVHGERVVRATAGRSTSGCGRRAHVVGGPRMQEGMVALRDGAHRVGGRRPRRSGLRRSRSTAHPTTGGVFASYGSLAACGPRRLVPPRLCRAPRVSSWSASRVSLRSTARVLPTPLTDATPSSPRRPRKTPGSTPPSEWARRSASRAVLCSFASNSTVKAAKEAWETVAGARAGGRPADGDGRGVDGGRLVGGATGSGSGGAGGAGGGRRAPSDRARPRPAAPEKGDPCLPATPSPVGASPWMTGWAFRSSPSSTRPARAGPDAESGGIAHGAYARTFAAMGAAFPERCRLPSAKGEAAGRWRRSRDDCYSRGRGVLGDQPRGRGRNPRKGRRQGIRCRRAVKLTAPDLIDLGIVDGVVRDRDD